MITGGGGSIFKYQNMVYKICPSSNVIDNPSTILEYSIPKEISKIFVINDSEVLNYFFIKSSYIRYGLMRNVFKAIHNLYMIYIMIYHAINLGPNSKITKENFDNVNMIDIKNNIMRFIWMKIIPP